MIKRYRKTLMITSIVTLLPMLLGLFLWNDLPDTIATHWGVDGAANGWSSKPMAVLGLPLFLLAIHWICVLGTAADPKRRDGKPLVLVLWICPIISLLCNLITYAVALGYAIDVTLVMTVFIGLLFIIVGNYLPKCQQNYTIGIKIPWTLDNAENWAKTHRFAGIVWVVCGCVILISALFRSFVPLFACFVLMVLLPVLYSYNYYRKHKQ